MTNRMILWTIAAIVLPFMMLAGCSSEAKQQIQGLGTTITDHVGNVRDKDNSYVLSVKGGYPYAYPDQTFGEAFEQFFAAPTWTYFKAESGEHVVEFTGFMTYHDVEVKARMQFIVDDESDEFEVGALSFNDVPQAELIKAAVLAKVFEDESADADYTVFPASLYDGIIEGLPIAIGHFASDIIQLMGEPETMDVWQGSYYYQYSDVTIFTDSLDLDSAQVSMIAIGPSFPFLNGVIGKTFEEIEAILGPAHSIEAAEDGDGWMMTYMIGGYSLMFEAPDYTLPTTYASFWQQL